MAEVKLHMDPVKGKELQAAMLKMKQDLGELNQQIARAIKVAGETWKDSKFNEFQQSYKSFQTGIAKFEEDLGTVAKVTLPPYIKAAEDYEKEKLKNQ